MKRIICIIAAIICLTAASAAAESHIGIQASFIALPEMHTVTIDLYEYDGNRTILSSLFPQYALKTDDPEVQADTDTAALLFRLCPDTAVATDNVLELLLRDWIDRQPGETKTGVFSGSLFESASVVSAYSFRMTELLQFLDENTGSAMAGTVYVDFLPALISSACSALQRAAGCEDPVIRVRKFDEGRYYTILICNENTPMLSVTADLSAGAEKTFLMTTYEDNVFCHRMIRYTTGTDLFALDSFLWTGSSRVFPGENTVPSCSAYLKLQPEGDGTFFAAGFSAAALEKPLAASGTILPGPGNTAEIHAQIGITGHSDKLLEILSVLDTAERPDGLTDMDPKNNTEDNIFRFALYSGELDLAAKVFPALPDDYQKTLWSLFFE